MNLYSIEMKLCATAYIKANTPAEALAKAQALKDLSPILEAGEGDVEISGRQFDDPELPGVSFSPAMNIHGPFDDHVELAAEDIPEPEEEEVG